jgi:transcriptional regulator with XRE-family HTH domain
MERNDWGLRSSYHANMAKKAPDPRSFEQDWFLPEWMASKKMSQAELGRRTGWSKATVNDIFHGKTNYYREIVNLAARALEVHPWELLMSPEEANQIKRLRTALDEEVHLRVAEAQQGFRTKDELPDRRKKAG